MIKPDEISRIFIDGKELEKRWHTTPQNLYHMRDAGLLKFVKISHRRILYDLAFIVDYENKNMGGGMA